jgi:hypothetical protein
MKTGREGKRRDEKKGRAEGNVAQERYCDEGQKKMQEERPKKTVERQKE